MRADKSLSPFEIRVYRHYRIVHGTRVALAFLLTFLIIRLFTIPESTWPLVTMVVIMDLPRHCSNKPRSRAWVTFHKHCPARGY